MTDQNWRELEQSAKEARAIVLEAEHDYEIAIRKAFPVGRQITYSHGDHRVRCEVIGHGHSDDLRVRGTYSGKEYMIGAYRAL